MGPRKPTENRNYLGKRTELIRGLKTAAAEEFEIEKAKGQGEIRPPRENQYMA